MADITNDLFDTMKNVESYLNKNVQNNIKGVMCKVFAAGPYVRKLMGEPRIVTNDVCLYVCFYSPELSVCNNFNRTIKTQKEFQQQAAFLSFLTDCKLEECVQNKISCCITLNVLKADNNSVTVIFPFTIVHDNLETNRARVLTCAQCLCLQLDMPNVYGSAMWIDDEDDKLAGCNVVTETCEDEYLGCFRNLLCDPTVLNRYVEPYDVAEDCRFTYDQYFDSTIQERLKLTNKLTAGLNEKASPFECVKYKFVKNFKAFTKLIKQETFGMMIMESDLSTYDNNNIKTITYLLGYDLFSHVGYYFYDVGNTPLTSVYKTSKRDKTKYIMDFRNLKLNPVK